MTQIDFHTGVADTLHYACRLLRKAWSHALEQKSTVLVVGELAWLDALDADLWTYAATDFIPHGFLRTAQDVLDSPNQLWLAGPEALMGSALQLHHVLVLFSSAPIERLRGFERFDRLVEIVGLQSDVVQAARARFQYYKARGYPLKHHARATR